MGTQQIHIYTYIIVYYTYICNNQTNFINMLSFYEFTPWSNGPLHDTLLSLSITASLAAVQPTNFMISTTWSELIFSARKRAPASGLLARVPTHQSHKHARKIKTLSWSFHIDVSIIPCAPRLWWSKHNTTIWNYSCYKSLSQTVMCLPSVQSAWGTSNGISNCGSCAFMCILVSP